MARKSRGARRRSKKKRGAPAIHTAPAAILGHVDVDADGYVDDLGDTIGDKRPARTKLADRLNSATNATEYRSYTVNIPIHFVPWLEAYAKIHGTDVPGVLDFAMRQVWRDDPSRTAGSTLPKADFDAMIG